MPCPFDGLKFLELRQSISSVMFPFVVHFVCSEIPPTNVRLLKKERGTQRALAHPDTARIHGQDVPNFSVDLLRPYAG